MASPRRRRRPLRLSLTIPTPVSVADLSQLLEALGPDYAEAEVRAALALEAPPVLEVWKRPPIELDPPLPIQPVLGTMTSEEP